MRTILKTSAIMLRRIEHGDSDFIMTFLTCEQGKISVIAKSAKKSVKRFAGILELFSELELVCTRGEKSSLYFLKEAALKRQFGNIWRDVKKNAYASYWTELIRNWVEEGTPQHQIYHLFEHLLSALDTGRASAEELSILFQMRLLVLSGLCPNLCECGTCQLETERLSSRSIHFDIKHGHLVCDGCLSDFAGTLHLSKGTIKQLLWVCSGDILKAMRMRFSVTALKEAQDFLERFVPYHMGKEPKSLVFLKQIRNM